MLSSISPHIFRIAITPGEPAGVGPDLAVEFGAGIPNAELVFIADAQLLDICAKNLRKPWHPEPYEHIALSKASNVRVLNVPVKVAVQPGQLDQANVNYVIRTLEIGCTGCLDGTFDALITGPVHKGIINQAGYPFTGHTEWLANRCNANPVMLLVTQGLRVALVTTHLPLAQVSAAITQQNLERITRILYRELQQKFNLKHPNILVCGLNPHAGEGGYLGREEQEIIEPVITRLQAEGLNLTGPLPADTVFTPIMLQKADAVLAMYHDQGLPVLKHIGFGRSANVTLGLPIIRVSVDHGTALDLAGTGSANSSSLRYAINTALTLCQHKNNLDLINSETQ